MERYDMPSASSPPLLPLLPFLLLPLFFWPPTLSVSVFPQISRGGDRSHCCCCRRLAVETLDAEAAAADGVRGGFSLTEAFEEGESRSSMSPLPLVSSQRGLKGILYLSSDIDIGDPLLVEDGEPSRVGRILAAGGVRPLPSPLWSMMPLLSSSRPRRYSSPPISISSASRFLSSVSPSLTPRPYSLPPLPPKTAITATTKTKTLS